MPRIRTIYVVRHAIAAAPGPEFSSDAERPLTADGIERWKRQVKGLRDLDAAIDHILTSPYVRTRQTAELLAAGMRPTPAVSECAALRPGGRFEDVIADVRAVFHAGAASVALVGHEPSIGRCAGRLIGATHPIPFKKGAVCRVDVDGAPGAANGWLAWFLPPKALRSLGG